MWKARLDTSMRVRFEDVEGNRGFVGEDLSLADYGGPDKWRVRIEESINKMDSGAEERLHGLDSLEGEERMDQLAEVLPTLTLIQSAKLEE